MILLSLLAYIALGTVITVVFAVCAYYTRTDMDCPPTYGQVIASGLFWPLVLFILAFVLAAGVFNTPLWGGKKEERDD